MRPWPRLDFLHYTVFQEWDLLEFKGERIPSEYEDTQYVELHFTLHIRRRTLYYFSNLILPCVIIGRAQSFVSQS